MTHDNSLDKTYEQHRFNSPPFKLNSASEGLIQALELLLI